ncbi:IucA/IucC family protein [Sinomicrobium weinanense]|uniref:IucA/IucC family siderophore biosynthesis protein n=1 Tax=Sinomicrobium weinanense TaxID=2842200 RepID=A0A926JNG2_9FLAO|nr:IucA/IucC family siderophore biosynthesis protein [Sinomicrobium weinanense]MBC9794518.1 IucA/IucC family siderophore biosynthesis protein [Sinomicrobium weinanense]MBU3124425.1 IucA/IucC family siderophore biosynthesis protein [Sinomicrobium weinanense]
MRKTLRPEETVNHLGIWPRVNRFHLRKIISEFAHERLLEPELLDSDDDWGIYRLKIPDNAAEYHFRARILSLDHWYIAPDSITKSAEGRDAPLDSIEFIIEFKDVLGFDDKVLPAYLEEVSSTLYGACYVHSLGGPTAKELTNAGYQEVEHAMIAGHPCFVANNGRIGFDTDDYRKYAPESAAPLSLIWLAGHRDRLEFTSVRGLDYDRLIREELGKETRAEFNGILTKEGLDPERYFFIPVHPWQWFNKLSHIFAADIAAGYLVCLGYGPDKYLPQQSIRTFFNVSHPEKHYVKTALSILNMGFMRGLSPYFMRTTPAINEWVAGIVENDDYLEEKGFIILKEVATVGYTNTYYEDALQSDSAYKKMLSALWRESPAQKVAPGQHLMTMASLLHTDMYGTALLPELIDASGLSISDWLKHYLSAYLIPLLHCFYTYDIRFMPHGENIILVLEDHVPVKVILKDVGEEVAAVNWKDTLPEAVKRVAIQVPEELKVLSIFTQIFDCFFRFLGQILVEHCNYKEEGFWELVAGCVREYQQRFPEREEKYDACDLFAPEMVKTCLNRLQIRDNQKMMDNADPFKKQQFAGAMKNPLAAFKTTTV